MSIALSSFLASAIRIAIICLFLISTLHCQRTSPEVPVEVRLVDTTGNITYDNKLVSVHIAVNGGRFTPLCGDTFKDFKVASVVCRQLGLGPPEIALSAYNSQSSFEYSYYTGSCNGTETSLSQCGLSVSKTFSECEVLQVKCLPSQASEFEVALVRSYEQGLHGYPLVFLGGKWWPLCSSELGNTVCNQLGLGDAADWIYVSPWVMVANDTESYYSFHCSDFDNYLEECSYTRHYCCRCAPLQKVSCRGAGYYDYDSYPDLDDDSGNHGGFIGRSYFSFLIVFIVMIFIAIKVLVLRSRAAAARSEGRTAPGRETVHVPPANQTAGNSSASYPRQQTDFGTEYSTSISFSENPPPYAVSASTAYPPPPVNGANVYPPMQYQPSSGQDPNLPTYEEVLQNNNTQLT